MPYIYKITVHEQDKDRDVYIESAHETFNFLVSLDENNIKYSVKSHYISSELL